MEYFYTTVFLVGVIYTVVSFVMGGLLGFAHLDGHIDTHIDMHMDTHIDTHFDGSGVSPTFAVFPIKPITVVSFLTVFGGVGLMGTRYKLNAVIVFILAIFIALFVAFILYRFVVVPLYKAQNTSAITQDKLIGLRAKVISPILENGFGTIAYVVNGSKYNAPAQHINKMSVPQGEEVMIYEIVNNVFYVQPLNESK
jgi:membrane-bound ClpP family serine protease